MDDCYVKQLAKSAKMGYISVVYIKLIKKKLSDDKKIFDTDTENIL